MGDADHLARLVWPAISQRIIRAICNVLGGIGAGLAHVAVTRRYDSRADYRDIPSLSAYKKSLQQAAYLTYAGLLIDFVLMG